MVKKLSPSELVAQFAEELAKQTDAIWAGDSRAGNLHAKRYTKAFERLYAIGQHGIDLLATLLSHERPDVRVAAASFLLADRTNDALAALQSAAAGSGFAAFEASQALETWKEGRWRLRPPEL